MEQSIQKEQIEAKPLSEKIATLGLFGLKQILTEDEYNILYVVLTTNHSMTTREVKTQYIEKLLGRGGIPIDLLDMFGGKFTSVPYPSFPKVQKSDEIKNLEEHIKEEKISYTKFVTLAEKALRKLKVKVLSYEKIERILFSLENFGIIVKRHDPLINAKYLWVINPAFLLASKVKK